jgi:hypothetical protein
MTRLAGHRPDQHAGQARGQAGVDAAQRMAERAEEPDGLGPAALRDEVAQLPQRCEDRLAEDLALQRGELGRSGMEELS